MFQCERISAKCVLFAAILFVPRFVQSKPGIESIRSKYGLDEIPRQDGANEHQIPESVLKSEVESRVERTTRESLENDQDYEYYDEAMSRSLVIKGDPLRVALGRSLFASEQTTTQRPTELLRNIGKCYRDRLTGAVLGWNSSSYFGSDPKSKLLLDEFCCQGYEQYVHDPSICVPVCSKGCVNGFCVRPDVCVCFPDHVQSLAGDCVPTCPIGCLNGHCYMNGTCACNRGYFLEPNRNFCVPYCSNGCGSFSNCTEPEICECIEGYAFNYSTRQCDPICNPPCLHGKCIKPNSCLCTGGYLLINNMCQANCSRGCENGRCVANEVCYCEPGWTLHPNRDKCLPHCSSPCLNGKCVGPDICTCNDGYIKEDGQCKPHCPRGCKYGTCTAPNQCKCRSGYYFNEMSGRCSKIRRYQPDVDEKPIHHTEVVINPKPQTPLYNPPLQVYPIYPQAQAPPNLYPQLNPYLAAPPLTPMHSSPPQSHPVPPSMHNSQIPSLSGSLQMNTNINPQSHVYPGSEATSLDLQLPPHTPFRPQNQNPIYNAQILAHDINGKTSTFVPQVTSTGNHSSIYDKQPPYNPFFQPNEVPPASYQNPKYLEKQPPYNPYFDFSETQKSTRNTTPTTLKPTTPKTKTHPKRREKTTTQKTILNFDYWDDLNASNQLPEVRTTRRSRPLTATTEPAKHKTNMREKHHNMTATTRGLKSVLDHILDSLKNQTDKSKAKTTPAPSCSRACLNGRCTGKNECTCNSGYIKAVDSKHKCIPNCRKGCLNGTCIGPDHCVCKVGFKKRHEKCVQIS